MLKHPDIQTLYRSVRRKGGILTTIFLLETQAIQDVFSLVPNEDAPKLCVHRKRKRDDGSSNDSFILPLVVSASLPPIVHCCMYSQGDTVGLCPLGEVGREMGDKTRWGGGEGGRGDKSGVDFGR